MASEKKNVGKTWTRKSHNQKEGNEKRVSRNSQKQKMNYLNYLILQGKATAVKKSRMKIAVD